MVKNYQQVEDFFFILHDTALIARNNGVLEVLKLIADSDGDSMKVTSQALYNLPRLGESFEYCFMLIGPSITAGTAYKDTTMGAGQAPECPRMDERILCEALFDITLTHSR
jgi:hypothetical protein